MTMNTNFNTTDNKYTFWELLAEFKFQMQRNSY